jgi:hypothetical protein
MSETKELIERLEPCPHCGPGQSVVELGQFQLPLSYWRVICGACGASSGTLPEGDRWPDAKERIREGWNKRYYLGEISRLTRERDSFRQEMAMLRQAVIKHNVPVTVTPLAMQETEIERLTRERDEALEALKPFAAIPVAIQSEEYTLLGCSYPQVEAAHYWVVIGTPDKSHFTREDLRRARSVLQSSSDSARDNEFDIGTPGPPRPMTGFPWPASDGPPKASMREPGDNIAELLAAPEGDDDEAFDRLLDVMRERKSSSDSGQGDE